MRAADRRQKRVDSVLRDALSPLLIEELQETTPALVTVTRVETAADLQSARVFLSLYGLADAGPVLDHLRRRTGALRRLLATRIKLKYNPMLFFELDPTPALVERLDELLGRPKDHDEDSD